MRPLVLALLLLAACVGSRGLPDWKTSPKPSASAKRVEYLAQITSTQVWQQSPYFREGESVVVPVYLIVAEDHTACLTSALDWTIASPGDFYPCPGKWRIPRDTP